MCVFWCVLANTCFRVPQLQPSLRRQPLDRPQPPAHLLEVTSETPPVRGSNPYRSATAPVPGQPTTTGTFGQPFHRSNHRLRQRDVLPIWGLIRRARGYPFAGCGLLGIDPTAQKPRHQGSVFTFFGPLLGLPMQVPLNRLATVGVRLLPQNSFLPSLYCHSKSACDPVVVD